MHNQQHLDQELEQVHQGILRMGTLVEEALRKAVSALEMKDFELAEKVIEADRKIDSMQLIVEEQCTRIIAAEQPVAGALREIITAIKITSTLERLGDHARHLARRVRSITDSTFIQTLPLIREMVDKDVAMLHDFLTAYVEHNADRAMAVAARDDEIDRLHSQLQSLITTIIRNNPESIDLGIDLLMANRFLERLGDHITNMCEWVVFAERAERVQLNN